MKIGILSDSHDSHNNVLKAVEIFRKQEVNYVLHAGDIVSPFTARAFSELGGVKFIAVFGNCDGEKVFLKETIEKFGGQIYPNAYTGKLDGKRIFMTHVPTALSEVAGSGNYDLVIYGHTHKQDIHRVNHTLVINPGETTDWLTGQSFVVIVELDDMSYDVVSLV